MRNALILVLLLAFASLPAAAATIRYSYDGAGRLVAVDYGNGKGIRYIYDANGNLLAKQDLKQQKRRSITQKRAPSASVSASK